MILPPVNHIIYIPLVLAIGVMLGWRMGARSVQDAWNRAERRRQREEEGV
ncbi:MAG: hypothetical protein AAFN74_16610 [Myxococcota bacterium]